MESIVELLIIYIFSYPGASIVWFISRLWKSKKTYKEILHDNIEINGVIGLFVIAIPVILFFYIFTILVSIQPTDYLK
ncbi:hypothetical protein [Aquimarina litoralis]|uniref:hypothetical protein n=1 Tax=Aquimarina litoralis TaxID=584605 RepID=UPI001C5A3334|nr:hypothetical protein [Aquimarina litoralis]MBW1296712.1 hypothetical protein [Aquimarina litoralis]